MRIAVCEDNVIAAEQIKQSVVAVFEESKIECSADTYVTAADFEQSSEKYDLIFLDCRLPDGNGIEIGRRLREKGDDAVLIFVTAYDEYVYDSFEVGAFRYLLKPINELALHKAVDAFIEYYGKNVFVEVPTAHRAHIINPDEIMYIEAHDKKSLVRLVNQSVESTKSIAEYQEEIISPAFFRTHRSYFINMKYIADITNNLITLTNGERVEISRRNMGGFNKSYINYLKHSARGGK